MPVRISEALKVDPEALEVRGVFDGFVDIDSQLYVDPHLLATSSARELARSHEEYCAYFDDVLRILRACETRGDRLFREAARRLLFREVPYVALGYAKDDTQGSGIGPKLATRLTDTALQIIRAGVVDPTIFDLVGLMEDNIGADRISDMTSRIIMPRLLEFSARIAVELGMPVTGVRMKEKIYNVPKNPQTRRPLILLPQDILRTLPVAADWSDRDVIAASNSALRIRVNGIIGDTWKRATRGVKKRELKEVLLQNPELLADLIEQYKKKPGTPYDFKNDPEGLFVWVEAAGEIARDFPLSLAPVSVETIVETVRTICEHFGRSVESNGLWRLFYGKDGSLRHESFPQLLFFAVADAYCEANNLDLSREPNAGRGPVDFKMSRGATAKVSVELKYTSNKQLVHGYETQLPIYEVAERTTNSIYLILRTTESENPVERVLALRNAVVGQGKRAPFVMIYDARPQRSASKATGSDEQDPEPSR